MACFVRNQIDMETTENKMETWPERCQERLQPIVERSRQAAVVTSPNGRIVYRFRVRVRPSSDYPYELGYSKTIKVTVTG